MSDRDASYLEKCPATPEYVLEVIRDSYRQQLQCDPEAEPGIELKFDSTISEWRLACDLVPWKPLGKALSSGWCFDATASEWKEVLEPSGKKRLIDVCRFIASRATRLKILPSRLLGVSCQSGGAFLAVREMLAKSGAEVSALRPSSPIEPYLNKYPDIFLDSISRLSPNTLPPIKVHDPVRNALCLIFLAALMLSFVFEFFDLPLLKISSVVLALLSMAIWRFVPAGRCEFPGIVTFRDLIKTLCPEDARLHRYSSPPPMAMNNAQ